MPNKRWPGDAVMIVASKAGEEDRTNMESVVAGVCRDCGTAVAADSFTIHTAEQLPSRLGRPVLFFCTGCCLNYDARTITELHDHRRKVSP